MAKKVKRAKAANVALPRPVTSPYTSPVVTLHFGLTHQKYYLPDSLLQRLENIPPRDPWTGEIHLADVDASIGHVLIHFLHTGVYQTLNDEDVESIENICKSTVRNEFQKAVLALEAARKYGVPGLQELAQIELERRGKDMCLREAVRAIREDFIAGPPDEHAWLRDYVSMKVQWTFEHDSSVLFAPGFFDSIESHTLTRLLAQVIVGLCSDELEKLRKERTSACKVSAPEHDEQPGPCSPDLPNMPSKKIVANPTTWPASVEKFGAFDDSVAAWDPHSLGQDPGSRLVTSALVALPSSIKEENHAKERGDTQSWELNKGVIEIQQLQAEQAAIAQSQERGVAAASSTATKAEVDGFEVQPLWDSWGGPPVAKKKKKSKMKTGYPPPPASPSDVQLEVDPTPVITDIATVATIISATQEDQKTEEHPYVGLSKSQATNLKTKFDKEAKFKEEEDGERQKEKEAAAIRRQKEDAEQTRLKEEERLAEEEKVRLEREEEERLAREAEEEAKRKKKEEEEAGPWATFSATPTIGKKKKKSKQAEQVGLEEEEAELKKMDGEEAATRATGAETCQKEDDPWGDWGSAYPTVKKKKKSRKSERIRLAEEEENERIRREKEEEAAAAATAADVSVVGSTGATYNDDDCKLRLEHLSRNDGWQNCEPCELYMRKIAIKFHSVGLPIEDGFSPID